MDTRFTEANRLARAASGHAVTVPAKTYIEMQERLAWLRALENAGVDNWTGIDFARDLFNTDGEGTF